MGTAWAMAKSQGAGAEGAAGIMGFLPMLMVMFFVLYFFIIRPQQKKQKESADMLSNLKKGDRVSTAGGMYGTVVGIKDNTVILKIAENTKVEFRKSSIGSVINKEEVAS